MAFTVTLHFTPATSRSTHVFATQVEKRWAPRWLVRLLVWPLLRRVAQQDQAMVELQERGRELFQDRRPRVAPLDYAALPGAAGTNAAAACRRR